MIDLLQFMQQSALMLSVSEATAHIKSLLDDDPILSDIWVRGEVGEARTYPSGHTYFSLRDGASQLKCVLFRQKARGLAPLESGRQYVVRGAISVYESSGAYQLYVTDHRPVGVGELYQEFEALKLRLEAEGLFAPERKRPLPRWPGRIGVATSAQGAVLHDLRQVVGRRYPLAELVLAPCQVQGAGAAKSVCASIRALDAFGVDVIVVARGGGSIEDLWAFNEESVARAIALTSVPVVSAIGHETDFTIADFVADVRAPTPSVAGELVVPDAAELHRQVQTLAVRADRAMQAQLWLWRTDLDAARRSLDRALAGRLERGRTRLQTLSGRLAALDPLGVLTRGFAVVRDADTQRVVRTVKDIHHGQGLRIRLQDGQFTATASAPNIAEQALPVSEAGTATAPTTAARPTAADETREPGARRPRPKQPDAGPAAAAPAPAAETGSE